MALDPRKIRACAPLLPDEEYRRRQRRLRRMFAWNTIATVCLIVVFALSGPSVQFGVGVQFGERLRVVIAFASFLSAVAVCFWCFFLFTLCYGQWAARRAHAYVDELEGRAS